MASLPIVRGASAAIYPFIMTISFLTEISQWQNGAQQRQIKSPGLVKFEIPYTGMSQTQKNTVKGAMASAKGRSSTNLQLTLGGITYTNLCLDSDEWIATESETTAYDGPMKLSQTIPQGLSPGAPGLPFPTLANGSMGILPYSQKQRFQSIIQKLETGPAHAYAEFGGGLAGYPTGPLMGWEFKAKNMSDADLATVTAHFIANYGRGYSFQFTDEDAVAYTKVHYAMDDLAVTYRGPNSSSVGIQLEATN
jgi:hypothetical protein